MWLTRVPHPFSADVRAVVDDEEIMGAVVPKARRLYNLSQMAAFEGPDGKFLTTEVGEVELNQYVDPAGGKVYTVDHTDKKVTGTRDATAAEMGGEQSGLREAVQTAVKTYVTENFSDSVMSATYAKDGKVVVCISGAEFDARNMWSGRWRSTWTCTVEGDNVGMEGEATYR